MKRFAEIGIILCSAALAITACSHSDRSADETIEATAATETSAVVATAAEPQIFLPANGPTEADYPELHNLFQVSDRIYSGAEPKTEESFASLSRLGVKTVVSVDGATPKVDLAEKYGLRYVHIPIGYDGVPEEAGLSLARLVQEVEGPFYVHCHHGTHRGPAAAAVACIADGDADGKQALGILEKAGTSENYAGLWRDVEYYRPPVEGRELPQLVQIAQMESLPAAMAKIDRNSDNLELCMEAGWKTPANHPDLVPLQEALMMKEGFRESHRNLSDGFDEQFKKWLKESETLAQELETSLKQGDTDTASALFIQIQADCRQCHKAYRN